MYSRVDVYRGEKGLLLTLYQIEDVIVYDDRLIIVRTLGENKENVTLKFCEFSYVNIYYKDNNEGGLVFYQGSYKGI